MHSSSNPIRRTSLLGATLTAVLLLSACGASTTTSAPITAPLTTIGLGVDPTATTVPTTLDTTIPVTTQAPTPPAPAPPPPAPTPAPPPPPPATTQPPTTTTTPTPVSIVDEADFFKARHAESGGGINSLNSWVLDPDNQRVQARTFHGPLAIAETADVKAMLYTSFQPRSSEATVTWDINWSGYMTSFIGADSAAQARITVRVYEIIPGSGAATIGPVVFSRTVADDGVGAALQGVATLRMDGGDNQTSLLPPLDVDKFYRLEAELQCSSRVAFSIGATACAFGDETTSGLKVNDWSIRFDNVPAT